MGFKLSEAFVEITGKLSKLGQALNKAKGMVVSGMRAAGLAAVAAFAAGFAGITAALAAVIPLVKIGSDLEEMRSKFSAVFKDQEDEARAWAAEFANAAGRSQVGLEGMLADMQALLVPMGMTREGARKMSTDLVQLAVDLGSFNNMTDTEALEKLRSGIMGEAEPLKALGIVINDVTLSAKLMELGLAKNAQEASESAKMHARMAIIMESTKDAQGDAARTADSLSNQWKRLTGSIYDLAANLGTALIPAAKNVVAIFARLGEWAAQNEEKIGAFAAGIGEAFDQVVGFLVDTFGTLYTYWQAQWDKFGPIVMEAFNVVSTVVTDALAFLVEGIVGFYTWITQLGGAFFSFMGTTSAGVATAGNSIMETWSKVKDWIVGAVKVIKEVVESIIFTIINWDLTTKRIGIAMAETFTNMLGRVQWFANNAMIAIQWFFNNWQDIGFTALDYILTGFINLGQNIRNMWAAVLDYFRTGKLEMNWTPLLEGAKNTIKQMPEFQAFKPADFNDQWAELDKETQRRMDRWNKSMAENAPEIRNQTQKSVDEGFKKVEPPKFNYDPKDKSEVKAATKKKNSELGKLTAVDKVWEKIQGSLFQKQDTTAKDQLNVQKEQLAETKGLRKDIKEKNKPPAAVLS